MIYPLGIQLHSYGKSVHYLIGRLEHDMFICSYFFHILGMIIPTVFHIRQRGGETTNQL